MYEVTAGATSQLVDIFVQDSSVTTGAGLSGLVYNTASLACYYKRQGASSWTAVTLADMTQGTWASGGFKEGDATHAKGVYEFGIPDAAIASAAGVTWVDFSFYGATNMAQVVLRIMLKKADFQDTVRLGLTALPNAAAGANTGLPVVGTQVPNATAGANNGLPIQGGAIPNANASASGGLLTYGTGTGQLSPANGKVTTTYGILKNAAFSGFEFLMTLASDHVTPATGVTVTAQRSIDGGAFGACTNAVNELSAGIYVINLSAADLNGNCITFKFTATACDATYVTVVTQS